MGKKVVRPDVNRKTLTVGDTACKLTPGLLVLITQKHPRAGQWKSDDYKAYKSLVAQTKVKSFPNRITGAARPHASWKWKHMLKRIFIPGERIAADDTDDTDTDADTASIGDSGESSPGILSPDSGISSPGPCITPPSPLHSSPYDKVKKTKKDREPFYKGYGVVYLPGDINGLTKKLHLLHAKFALLRLKQLTRKEYADITARLE